jgi:hypothetical protein
MKTLNRIGAYLIRGCLAIVMGIMGLWAFGAITYSNLPAQWMRTVCAILFLVIAITIFCRIKPFYKAVLAYGILWCAVLVWWLWIPASNTRTWQPDVAVLPSAQIEGSKVTVRNIRNCDYRTTSDFTVSHYDKTFDLEKLEGADLFIIYWGSPLIAHTIMSFCFEGGDYLCVSIEIRREAGETYSAIKGFFKQYELIYIVADERDLIRLRTNFRKETVYLYRLNAKPQMVRKVLLDYLKSVNSLNENPEWYNALTQNCTTSIRGHTAPYAHGKMSWKMIVNGYLDTLLYERRAVDTSMPFEQFKELSCINDRAMKAGDSLDYSDKIRTGLPGRQSQEKSDVPR